MNNKEFITALAAKTGYTQGDTQRMLNTLFNAMTSHLQEDTSVVLPTIGTFEVKKKMERIIVNPNTKQRMLVPPKLVLGFRPASQFKDELKKGEVKKGED